MRSFYGAFQNLTQCVKNYAGRITDCQRCSILIKRKIGYMEECVNNNLLIMTGFNLNLILAIKKTVKEFLTMHR